jgi:DNA-binding CsgD family transcriptional regulator
MNRKSAQALAEAGVPVERVGEQLQAAVGVMDSWTLNWLVDNGAALVNRASQPAIDLLARAAEHIPRTDPRREAIESRMVAALRRMLRFGEVEQRTRAMLASEGISTEHRLEMSWALAYSLLYSSPPDGAQVAREAIAYDDGGRWGGRVRAMLALILAVDRHCGDPYAAIRDAHAAGQRTGDRWTMATVLQAEAMIISAQNFRRSTELFQQALATIGDDPQTSDVRVVLMSNIVKRLDELGRPDEADPVLADMLSFTERFPSAISVTRVHVYAAERHLDVGQWDDVLAELESVEPRAEHGYLTVEALSTGALIAGHRDDRASAAAQLAALDVLPIGAEVIRNHSTKRNLARALLEERDGRQRAALDVLLPMLDPELDFEPADRLYWLPEMVRLALALGEREVAKTGTEQAIADAGCESPTPFREAGAAACRGLLAGDPELLLAAAENYRLCRKVLDRGIALENAAVLFGERGDLAQARTAIDAATEEYTKLAATWDMTRAEARMRPFGIRRGQRGPRGRPASGWDSLTPTELRVAFFIADGLSNPGIATELFLSRRTVQTHVSHILAKLNARSRAEVASEAARRRNGPHGGGPRPRSAS